MGLRRRTDVSDPGSPALTAPARAPAVPGARCPARQPPPADAPTRPPRGPPRPAPTRPPRPHPRAFPAPHPAPTRLPRPTPRTNAPVPPARPAPTRRSRLHALHPRARPACTARPTRPPRPHDPRSAPRTSACFLLLSERRCTAAARGAQAPIAVIRGCYQGLGMARPGAGRRPLLAVISDGRLWRLERGGLGRSAFPLGPRVPVPSGLSLRAGGPARFRGILTAY